MDTQWQPLERDAIKDVTVLLYASSSSPAAILDGDAPLMDLTPFASRVDQTNVQLTVTLAWHHELDGEQLPRAGQWLCARLNGRALCVQQLDAITDYRVMHGVTQATLIARSRDATARWRDTPISTRPYAMAASTIQIVRDVAMAMGMRLSEVRLAQLGTYVPRANMQATGVSAWTLLERVMLPAGIGPAIDALGRLHGYSRDVLRAEDVRLTDDRVDSFGGSRSTARITRLSLRWRPQQMVTIFQPESVLASASITAGYFAIRQSKRVYWSEDQTQRATNVRMVVARSANRFAGMVDETMSLVGTASDTCIGADIMVRTNLFMPIMLGGYAFIKVIMAFIPDLTAYVVTIPLGRLVESAIDLSMFTTMFMIGTGNYELLGQTIDAVEQTCRTDAYDPTASPASVKTEMLESDYVVDDETAKAFVTREFIYRVRASTSFSLAIVDDPRIEIGDIVQLADGTRLFVTGFRRDLSPGSAALLELTGFPA